MKNFVWCFVLSLFFFMIGASLSLGKGERKIASVNEAPEYKAEIVWNEYPVWYR
jgi:hypothetical protein